MDQSRKQKIKGNALLALLPLLALLLGLPGLNPAGAATEAPQGLASTAVDETNLLLRREGTAATAVAGRQFKYTLALTNNGPEHAADVLVADSLPAGYSFAEASNGCTINTPRTVSCRPSGSSMTVPPYVLPAGATAKVDLVVQIAADVTGSFPNAATASAGNEVTNVTVQGAAIPVVQQADLLVRKFGRIDGLVQAGENLIYTIVVDNLGPSVARNAFMDDVMRSDGTFELVSVASSRTAVCAPASGEFTGELDLSCDLPAALEVRSALDTGRWTITVVVRASERQRISNLATVESDAFDPDLVNNEARAEHRITDVADLGLSKTAEGQNLSTACPAVWEGQADQVTAGAALQYVLTVDNSGPSTATNVLVHDQLPAGFKMTGVQPSKGSCNIDTVAGTVVCGLGSIAVGSSVTITIDGLAAAGLADGSLLINNAQMTSGTYDDNNGNDFANNVTAVYQVTDLKLAKEARGDVVTGWDEEAEAFVIEEQADTVSAGSTLRYRFTVQNDGPNPVDGIMLQDRLPFELQEATGATCQEDESDPALTLCAIDSAIPAGAAHVVELSGQVPDDLEAASVITNEASVSSPTSEACAEDNAAQNETAVITTADRYVLLENDLATPTAPGPQAEDPPEEITPGSEHRYKVTIGNNGPSSAESLQLIARLDTVSGDLAEWLQRCEPIEPLTEVDCVFEPPFMVRVRSMKAGDEEIFPSAADGRLGRNETYSFHLITAVSTNFLEVAESDLIETSISIAGSTTDYRSDNNVSKVTTRVVPEGTVTRFLTLLPLISSQE